MDVLRQKLKTWYQQQTAVKAAPAPVPHEHQDDADPGGAGGGEGGASGAPLQDGARRLRRRPEALEAEEAAEIAEMAAEQVISVVRRLDLFQRSAQMRASNKRAGGLNEMVRGVLGSTPTAPGLMCVAVSPMALKKCAPFEISGGFGICVMSDSPFAGPSSFWFQNVQYAQAVGLKMLITFGDGTQHRESTGLSRRQRGGRPMRSGRWWWWWTARRARTPSRCRTSSAPCPRWAGAPRRLCPLRHMCQVS